METYKEKFDKIAESVYNKIMEVAQQPAPAAQVAQPAPAALAAPVGPTTPADPSMAVQPAPEQQAAPDVEEGGVDEVGMSEIQELAGQLAQMLRDFKESNPDEFTEAAKFAAGMVVSAAIKGLKYRDRKDILKKIKAGETEQAEGEEASQEAQPAEQPEQMVAERLRKDDSRDAEDNRKELKPKEKKNIRSKKSPFSGVNEDTIEVGDNTPNSDVEAAVNKIASTGGTSAILTQTGKTQTSGIKPIKNSDSVTNGMTDLKSFGTDYDVKVPVKESIKLTKRQLEMIRLHESKTKMFRFKKGQLDEAMKG